MQKMESRRLNNNMVVEIDENMLRREISRMRTLREADETKPQSWGHGAGDLGDLEDEDLGDPLLDIELSEAQDLEEEVDEGDNEHGESTRGGYGEKDDVEAAAQQAADDRDRARRYEAQSHQKNQGQQKRGQQKDEQDGDLDEADDQQGGSEQVQEIRRRLTREGQVQSGAKQKAQSAKKRQREAQQKAKLKEQESRQKAKQKKQQEAQKAKLESQKQVKQAKKMQEAYAYYANIFNESVRRTARLQSVLLAESRKAKVIRHNGITTRSTAETSNLRKKLAETNLFNTKLLYCNKLLQNETLTKRQKADVIERLDEAKTEREVTLVYESLVKTLGRPRSALAEGTHRVLGSSSQVTRPASTFLSEGGEAERWAKLAGLK